MKNVFLFLFFIVLGFTCSGQITDIKFLEEKCLSQKEPVNGKNKLQQNRLFLPESLILMYKSILSEQISANCEFELSCSSFSLLALREYGFITCVLLTADRLTRCGSSSEECSTHLINRDNAKIIDYPAQYIFKK